MDNKYEERLGTASMLPLILKMALPGFAAQLINLLYSIVDRVFIGHIELIGTDALAGIGVTSSIIILISAFSQIVGGGGAPLASIALGKGDRERAHRILGNGFSLLVLFAVVTSGITYIFMDPLLRLIGASDATIGYAADYLSVYLTGTLFALGIAPFIMASTESLVGFVLNGSLSGYGDIYVSTLTVMQSAMQFAAVPLSGFAQGFIPIVSYNYGKGNTDRVRLCFKYSVIIMFSFFALTNLFMITFPEFVAGMFTDDTALIKTVGRMMPLFLTGMTIFGLQRTCQSMFVALGQAKISLFIALLRKVILLIPLALILPNFLGVKGVYLAESVADATSAICCTVIFALTFRKILKKREQT